MNVSGEPLLSPALLVSSLLPPWRSASLALPHSDVRLFNLGRHALAAAVESLPPGPVLVPAFICREAVDGIRAAGRDVRFYSLGPDMNPVWASIDASPEGRVPVAGIATGPSDKRGARSRTSPAAAMVLVHYFGVPADAARARRWCDERGITLIEDCAHSFLSAVGGRPVGSEGDFAVFSFRKQLPVSGGAALVINAHPGSSTMRLRSGRSGVCPVPAVREVAAWAVFSSGSGRLRRWLAPSLSDESMRIGTPPDRAQGIDLFARRIVAKLASRSGEIAVKRRANYKRLEGEFHDLPRLAPLFANLPNGAVPWGLPLKVAGGGAARDELLLVLLHEGIGAWKWPDLPEEVTQGGFPAALMLARETLVLPVHQNLSQRHVQHIADTVSGWALSSGEG